MKKTYENVITLIKERETELNELLIREYDINGTSAFFSALVSERQALIDILLQFNEI